MLATLEFLAASGMRPTVTSLKCGHGFLTSSGNVSQHSSGNAVDIAKINGIPILGNQGAGSITELAVRRLLTLQGTMKPDQIITLMKFEGADNTLAMADHADHIHVGWRPLYGTNSKAAKQVNAVLKPKQWIKLIDRLQEIDNPTVRLPALQARAEGHRARLRGAPRRVEGSGREPPLLLRAVGVRRAPRPGGGPLRDPPLRGGRPAACRRDRRARGDAPPAAGAAAAARRPRRARRRTSSRSRARR